MNFEFKSTFKKYRKSFPEAHQETIPRYQKKRAGICPQLLRLCNPVWLLCLNAAVAIVIAWLYLCNHILLPHLLTGPEAGIWIRSGMCLGIAWTVLSLFAIVQLVATIVPRRRNHFSSRTAYPSYRKQYPGQSLWNSAPRLGILIISTALCFGVWHFLPAKGHSYTAYRQILKKHITTVFR